MLATELRVVDPNQPAAVLLTPLPVVSDGIAIELPYSGASIVSPVRVSGRLDTVVARHALQARVHDGHGQVIGEMVLAVSGEAGAPGAFVGHIPFATAAGGSGTISVVGGKLTTYRRMAEDAVEPPGVTVDGNDVYAVYEAAEKAIERARKGLGPSLIEAKTCRWRGHWTGDPEVYRTREEVAAWMEKCPIKRMRAKMLEDKVVTEAELDAIEQKAKADVEEATDFALNSPEPDPATVMDHVYYEG